MNTDLFQRKIILFFSSKLYRQDKKHFIMKTPQDNRPKMFDILVC